MQSQLTRISGFFTSRFAGFIPLLLFGLKCWQYRNAADWPQLLWFCNAANLILAVALFLRWGNGVFICTVLLIIGLPIWVFDFIVNGDFHVVSVFTHVLSPLIGVLAARHIGFSSHAIWQTLLLYVFLQVMARLLTPAPLNINVAFAIYAPVAKLFPNFYVYSASNMVGLGLWAWVAHRLLRRRLPVPRA